MGLLNMKTGHSIIVIQKEWSPMSERKKWMYATGNEVYNRGESKHEIQKEQKSFCDWTRPHTSISRIKRKKPLEQLYATFV